ncbi:MAG: arginine--tRNA ligase, partial [Alphaproteobacteria bacterium]|nr:arginine--tRNA ligase [Alphaproteobacteria bacterium]
MNRIIKYLQKELADIFNLLGFDTQYAIITPSNRPDISQYQCNAAFELCKPFKTNPKEIAQRIVDKLADKIYISTLSIDGPGFINITLTDSYLIKELVKLQALARAGQLGCYPEHVPKITIIDFCGANVAKPMHVGHLRSTIIGDSLSKLARHLGDKVITDNHIGDWGTQMGMLICFLKEKKPDLAYFDSNKIGDFPKFPPVNLADLENMYPEASSRAKTNEAFLKASQQAVLDLQKGHLGYRALWQHFVNISIQKLKLDLQSLNIEFDLWRGESYYQEMIPKMVDDLLTKGLAQKSEGAIILPIDEVPGLENGPPLLLMKRDGASLYHTTDLATVINRSQEHQAQRILYVVDKRQELHFKQVFAAYKKITRLSPTSIKTLEHIGFGTVNGKDGKPYKTRDGGTMKLGDLIELVIDRANERMIEMGVADSYTETQRNDIAKKVGMATLKFADLINNRLSDYIFDIDKFSTFEGKTGPYILYTVVRIKSILNKALNNGYELGAFIPPLQDQNKVNKASKIERDLILELSLIHISD